MPLRISALLLLALLVQASERAVAPSTDQLLYEALAANRDLYTSLESFVCQEKMERYRGRAGVPAAQHIDTVIAKVSFENGAEHYSDLIQTDRPLLDLADLRGAWSEGEFGTLLKQTGQLLTASRPAYEGESNVNGEKAVIYTFDTPAADSPWSLTVAGAAYLIPFRTRVWISKTSRFIVKIERRSDDVPDGLRIASLTWSVTLSPVNLNGKEWLLPSRGLYQVTYRFTDRREWNTLEFSNYHRYGSEVAIRFQ